MTKKTEQKKAVISDYNGYNYRKLFWEDADRKYEDLADRIAIRRLLPHKLRNFVDIAGGYGRLADEYLGRAAKVTLFDYSQTELNEAKAKYGDRIQIKQGDVYHLPFADNEFAGLMMIRALHHLPKVQQVASELYRILAPKGVAVVEVANKRTLPRILRYWLGKSPINPFERKPANLKHIDADGFYNYHPKYIEAVFRQAGFKIEKVLSVSNFRSRGLKRVFGTKFLVGAERICQPLLAPIRFAPSIYYRLVKPE